MPVKAILEPPLQMGNTVKTLSIIIDKTIKTPELSIIIELFSIDTFFCVFFGIYVNI